MRSVEQHKNIILDAEAEWNAKRNERERFVRLYEHGRFPSDGRGMAQGASVNLCYPYVQAYLSILLADNPTVEVDARRNTGDVVFAEAMEKWLSYSWDESESFDAVEVALFDALLRGIGWIHESFDADAGIDTCECVSPLDMYVDPLARRSEREGRYIVRRIVKPIEEVRDFFGDDTLSANYTLSDADGLEQRGKSAKAGTEKDLLEFYEIWEKAGQTRLNHYFLRDEMRYLAQRPWPYMLDHGEFPFSCLRFNTNFEGVDGFSEQKVVEMLGREVQELFEFDRRATRRGAAAKIVYDKGVFSSREARKFASMREHELVAAKLGNKDLRSAIQLVELNGKTNDQKDIYSRAKGMHDEVLGFDELLRGADTDGGTATEARVRDQYNQLRISRRRKLLDRFLIRSFRHRAQIARALVDPQLVGRALGDPNAAWAFATYAGDAEDLVREFSIKITAGSTGEIYRAERVQEAQENLALFTNVNSALMAQGQAPMFNVGEAAMEILKSRNERNPERFLLAPPQAPQMPMDPMQQQMQMGQPGMQPDAPPAGVPVAPQGEMVAPQPAPIPIG